MEKSSWIKKFYSFDAMITPSIIKAIFWVLAIASIVCGIITIINSFGQSVPTMYGVQRMGGSFWLFIFGVLQMTLGVVFSKIFCEMIIVIFKINENLASIRKSTCNGSNVQLKNEDKINE
ncbi:DUF4282 domain-containing protein [Cysteiniphilum marinum]|uniref:DUF4282 domain-containing protein n=1 Tax=Cysteiniphilum marinum TaxID=2774191 RepID=UPI00193AC31C|nr:DUF4282 domain-containing protein [Cysteiniphilum marinum]